MSYCETTPLTRIHVCFLILMISFNANVVVNNATSTTNANGPVDAIQSDKPIKVKKKEEDKDNISRADAELKFLLDLVRNETEKRQTLNNDSA